MKLKLTDDILGVEEFHSKIDKALEQVEEQKRPMILTKNGRANYVVLDVHSYESMNEPLEQSDKQSVQTQVEYQEQKEDKSEFIKMSITVPPEIFWALDDESKERRLQGESFTKSQIVREVLERWFAKK